jgi:hypothetical protein
LNGGSDRKQREFELLAAGYRLWIEFLIGATTSPWMRQLHQVTAKAVEHAIAERSLVRLRGSYSDVKRIVGSSTWGPQFLQRFESQHGISFLEIRRSRTLATARESLLGGTDE